MTINFSVNGIAHRVDPARGAERLIDFLHEELNLTGTKFCCGIGVCRACTVSSTRAPNPSATPVASCSTSLAMVDGTAILTIEGVAEGVVLASVQEAFLREFSFQCGYCAPGFVMASKIFLDELRRAPIGADALDAAIEAAIGSHICRCTGYVRYHQAVKALAESIIGEKG
jgi:aerobic-type carbon monoxide dehydrogenase small subunit (CoxS/CutS family)